jgi:hypothetical protein
MAIGDALDRALGGPAHFTSQHCADGHHTVCMAFYGGRSCECACHIAGWRCQNCQRSWTFDPDLDEARLYCPECGELVEKLPMTETDTEYD